MATRFPIDILQHHETPFYYYDLGLLKATLDRVKECSAHDGYKLHYAVKANANPTILRLIASYGLGADVVSGGEIQSALDAGFRPEDIVFAGVGKSDWEIKLALDKGIGCLNVESLPELEVIEQLASEKRVIANIALRVNPNIDAHTHHYITTGLSENKFGIALEQLDDLIERAKSSKWISLTGLHFHIGSQITITEPFAVLCNRINQLCEKFASKGIFFKNINVGGGLGIDYDNPDSNPIPDFKHYFDTFYNNLTLQPGQELHFELGRSIVAQCGSLITKVLFVKKGLGKQFAIVDAGFTELIRPALYQAHHLIQNLSSKGPEEKYDVVGPICESSDVFAMNVDLPSVKRGDIFAIRSAGAYGEIMASHYNCRSLHPALFSKD